MTPGPATNPCARCLTSGWVCENHDDQPWEGMFPDRTPCCLGAGMPCLDCRPEMADVVARKLNWRWW